MKRLTRLKLSENQILPKSSLNHLLGGGNDEPIDGGTLPEVVVYPPCKRHEGSYWDCPDCKELMEASGYAYPRWGDYNAPDPGMIIYHYYYQKTH